MFEYYHDNEKKKDVIFDSRNSINSMNDKDFKAWFAFDKQKFSRYMNTLKNVGQNR